MERIQKLSSIISAAIPNDRVEAFIQEARSSGLTCATVRSDSPYGKTIGLTPNTTWVVAERIEQKSTSSQK